MSGVGKSTVLTNWPVADTASSTPMTRDGSSRRTRRTDQNRRGTWTGSAHYSTSTVQVGLFVAGCVANQGVLCDRFDKVLLLSAPIDILLGRVSRRDNPFGSRIDDRTKTTSDVVAFEPVLRRGADDEIVTTAPIAAVVSEVENIPAIVR